MKVFFKNIINKIKSTWQNDYKDVLIPVVTILLLIIIGIIFGIMVTFIILINMGAICHIYKLFEILSNKNLDKSVEKVVIKEVKKEPVMKKVKKPKEKKKGGRLKKALKILLLLILTFFILGIIAVIAFFIYIVVNAPKFDESNFYLSEPTIVLSKDGEEIAKLGAENRIIISYDELPEVLIDAIVATEDSRFFEHNGVDWARFMKASVYQLMGKDEAGGASTLTMQVSKNRYTTTEASGLEGIIRKFTDVYVSMFLIEKNYTKEQIMEFYVNYQWLGKNANGVEQTSIMYFGKSAKDLNLSEAAMIAGLFQSPGAYDPYKNPEATEARRIRVLKLMLRHKYINENEYEIAKKLTVDKIVIPKEESVYSKDGISEYQSFIDTVVDEVKEKTGQNPYSTSMTIYTTLDTQIQDYLNGIMNGETYNWENDVVQAGVAILDINDGSVAALGGGRNVSIIDGFNYATDIKNQIGSTAKPLYDYGPAIEYSNWDSYHLLVDEPYQYSTGVTVNNWNGTFEGLESLRTALGGSRNIPALKAFQSNNKAQVIEFVTNLGLSPEIYSCPTGYFLSKKKCINRENYDDVIDAYQAKTLHEAHALGGYNGESPLTMAAAYAAFANKGVYTKPYTFTKIIYNETGEEFINSIEQNKAMSEETAYMMTHLLTTTAVKAMGKFYNINGVKYCAKTGTTNFDEKIKKENKMAYNAVNDLWTVGYNTKYSMAVWYGYDHIDPEYYNIISGLQHARLFQAIGKKVFTDKSEFEMPKGVVEIEVEKDSYEPMLPSEFTPEDMITKEVFLKDTEPTTVSSRFSKLSNVTNLKSNVTDKKITLTWTPIDTPIMNTTEYLTNTYKSLFKSEEYLQEYVNSRLDYITNNMGTIEYDIYLKNSDDSLTLLDHTSASTFEKEFEEAGTYNFVVKTTYSIFKDNMSDGASTSATIIIEIPVVPEEPIEEPPIDDNQHEENNPIVDDDNNEETNNGD